jgi:hypothetical protein
MCEVPMTRAAHPAMTNRAYANAGDDCKLTLSGTAEINKVQFNDSDFRVLFSIVWLNSLG